MNKEEFKQLIIKQVKEKKAPICAAMIRDDIPRNKKASNYNDVCKFVITEFMTSFIIETKYADKPKNGNYEFYLQVSFDDLNSLSYSSGDGIDLSKSSYEKRIFEETLYNDNGIIEFSLKEYVVFFTNFEFGITDYGMIPHKITYDTIRERFVEDEESVIEASKVWCDYRSSQDWCYIDKQFTLDEYDTIDIFKHEIGYRNSLYSPMINIIRSLLDNQKGQLF